MQVGSLIGVASRFVRKVRTASGGVAVQVITREGRQVVEVDHVGSAHSDADLDLLLQAAEERLRPGQGTLDLGPLERTRTGVDDVADWTGTDPGELKLESSLGGRPRVVGGRAGGVDLGAGAVASAEQCLCPSGVRCAG